MKSLFVIRHAKSSWKDLSLDDHERPLNKRGKRNIPEMGEYLHKQYGRIDTFVSSHAVRAYETAKGIAAFYEYPISDIVVTDELYHAGNTAILQVVSVLSDDHESAAIFGHNPGFTFFVNAITNSKIDNIPTCGVAVITFDTDSWCEAAFGKGKLALYTYPKAL